MTAHNPSTRAAALSNSAPSVADIEDKIDQLFFQSADLFLDLVGKAKRGEVEPNASLLTAITKFLEANQATLPAVVARRRIADPIGSGVHRWTGQPLELPEFPEDEFDEEPA